MRSLLPLSVDEDALIRALRADPDQQRHVVDVRDEHITVRHPISERLHGDALFACPVLAFADAYFGPDANLATGRWRLNEAGDDFDLILEG